MSGEDRIPEEIREQLLDEGDPGVEEDGSLDEGDLDNVAGGASYTNNANLSPFRRVRGFGLGSTDLP